MAAAVGGDRLAVEDLLAAVRPVVVAFCRRRVPPAHVEDVVQETCVELLGALPRYRPDVAPFEAFATGVTRRTVADFWRRVERDRSVPVAEVPDTVEYATPAEAVEARELSRALLRLLAEATGQQRAVLLLRVVAGLSTGEVADALHTTPGAVRVIQHRAVHRLRRAAVLLPV
ncbi:sigma-70 family RNA polymerase sigma factor [Saccharothrix lopnurensis]|uniref:Sigma-70 family RNA polymerase sigma factor n=1 Tax=Saccharothrix lopnurensis TaxID=1670621 RepID=A0ABW1P6J7_9PSEU